MSPAVIITVMTAVRICKNCKSHKEITGFARDSSRASGYKSLCRICFNLYQKQKRAAKPKKIKIPKPKPTITEKICTGCKELKSADQFNNRKSGRGGLTAICKKCHSEQGKKRYHKKVVNEVDFREQKNKRHRENTQKLKEKVLFHYSNGSMSCACCGNKYLGFLVIDHINGGGNKEKKENKLNSPEKFHYFLIQRDFPEGYRVLCHNCNLSLGIYGYCPHQK